MRKFIVLVVLLLLTLMALADTVSVPVASAEKTRSVSIDKQVTGLGVTYLNDGVEGLVGLSWHAYSLTPRLSLNVLTVTPPGGSETGYVGTLLTYKIYEGNGFSLSVGVGYKGIDLTNLAFTDNKAFIYGVQFSLPLKL